MNKIKLFLELTCRQLNLTTQSEELLKIEDALNYMLALHYNHRDKDGSFFIYHPLGVSEILITIAGCKDIDIIRAGLLHDVMERSDIDNYHFIEQFGEPVFRLVEALTKHCWLGSDVETRTINYVKRIKEIGRDAALIKLADRLERLQRIECREFLAKSKYINDTMKYYSILADSAHEAPVVALWAEIMKNIKKNEKKY